MSRAPDTHELCRCITDCPRRATDIADRLRLHPGTRRSPGTKKSLVTRYKSPNISIRQRPSSITKQKKKSRFFPRDVFAYPVHFFWILPFQPGERHQRPGGRREREERGVRALQELQADQGFAGESRRQFSDGDVGCPVPGGVQLRGDTEHPQVRQPRQEYQGGL